MIASERGEVGLAAGMDLLRAGASAIDELPDEFRTPLQALCLTRTAAMAGRPPSPGAVTP
jgi:hypothetical protein